MSNTLLRMPAVLKKTGLAKSTIYALIAKGDFPKPVKSGHRSLWVETEVDAHVASLIAERDGAAA